MTTGQKVAAAGAVVVLAVGITALVITMSQPPPPAPQPKLIWLAWDHDGGPNIVYELRETTNLHDWVSVICTNTTVGRPVLPYAFYIVRAYDYQLKVYSDWNTKSKK